MAAPFLPLLSSCSRSSVADDRVRLLALRCLEAFLKWTALGPSLAKYAKRLGKSLLQLLTWASRRGVGLGNSDLVQGCFRGLTTLLQYDPPPSSSSSLSSSFVSCNFLRLQKNDFKKTAYGIVCFLHFFAADIVAVKK